MIAEKTDYVTLTRKQLEAYPMRPKVALTTVILMSLQCVIAAQAQSNGPLRVHPEKPALLHG